MGIMDTVVSLNIEDRLFYYWGKHCIALEKSFEELGPRTTERMGMNNEARLFYFWGKNM